MRLGKNIALLVVVIGIWSYVGYFLLLKNKVPVESRAVTHDKDESDGYSSTFELGNNYDDPFLKQIGKRKDLGTSRDMSYETAQTKKNRGGNVESPTWPSIKYFGYTQKDGLIHLVVSFDNNSMMLSPTENYEDISIKYHSLDSIICQKNGELVTIPIVSR